MAEPASNSYIDYETFLSPDFSATNFANTLVLATNDPTDAPLDLSTPLTRVLFDVQEIDTHIDTLTTQSALPLLSHTATRAAASTRILEDVEAQVASLTEGYKRLEKDVVERYEAAEQVQLAAERLCATVKLGRSVARCLQLGRQLEGQMGEFSAENSGKREAHRGLVPAVHTLLQVRQVFNASGPGQEGEGLGRVNVVTTLRNDLIEPSERTLLSRAQQIVREFSISSLLASTSQQTVPGVSGASAATFAQNEDTKSRTTSALHVLYYLSPTKPRQIPEKFAPHLLISALQAYLQTQLQSSLASLARALATLPTLDRTLLEISGRCQNIVALEALLATTKTPRHPLLTESTSPGTESPRDLLTPLLNALDTASLPSFFWRSLASNLSSRVQEILNRGGVSARTLRSNRDRVREAVRECVARGSELPSAAQPGRARVKVGNWEREAAVMVGAIVGPLGR
ncbi:Golgi transport complex subunit 5-domain-containing protein [Delphinella strobiligena]|nr:Golgi transport complex subunit 5-domain-containing protein [Delphinella strobiligena]